MIKSMTKNLSHSLAQGMALALGCWLSATGMLYGQTSDSLTLEVCYQQARKNYPLVKQFMLTEKAKEYAIDNVSKGSLPQLHFGGQATYQSDVTQIPFSLPDVDIPVMSKDQYKIYGELMQPVTDLFTTVKYQKELIQANTAAKKQKTEVELYKLKERIDHLYFGTLLLDAQITQAGIVEQELASAIKKDSVAIVNGVALKSSADVLRAEWLKTGQRITELKATRKAYTDMLSLFIHQPVGEKTILKKPHDDPPENPLNRPELKWFDLEKKTFDVQRKLVMNKTLPKFSLFVQGGYGRPALNMLKNEFNWYYVGGIRLSWNISGFYTSKKDKQLLDLNQSALDLQKETFLFNTNLKLKQQNDEITKLEELMKKDKDIIRLRENVKRSAQNQLTYGTATANDYLTYVHAEDEAKQAFIIHEIQLLMAQYNYKTTSGN